jgi:hypothetical protein
MPFKTDVLNIKFGPYASKSSMMIGRLAQHLIPEKVEMKALLTLKVLSLRYMVAKLQSVKILTEKSR